MDRKRSSSADAIPSTSSKRAVITWNEHCLNEDAIRGNVEKTWILESHISIPGIGEFYFKTGNKDYHLTATPNEGERQSDLSLKKKYR